MNLDNLDGLIPVTTNDAAERLLEDIRDAMKMEPFAYAGDWIGDTFRPNIDAALAAERRATVERIRAIVQEIERDYPTEDYVLGATARISEALDAEAER